MTTNEIIRTLTNSETEWGDIWIEKEIASKIVAKLRAAEELAKHAGHTVNLMYPGKHGEPELSQALAMYHHAGKEDV